MDGGLIKWMVVGWCVNGGLIEWMVNVLGWMEQMGRRWWVNKVDVGWMVDG